MFGKFLRKEYGFWRLKADGNEVCFCKHSPTYGGIYAYIQPGIPGVRIVANGFVQQFADFTRLSSFLDQLEATAQKNHNGLVSALYRNTSSRSLRMLAL